jgi:hypothetical protein
MEIKCLIRQKNVIIKADELDRRGKRGAERSEGKNWFPFCLNWNKN